jgi:hypothetical protein
MIGATVFGRLAEAIRKAGYASLVTADHGNCEIMRDAVADLQRWSLENKYLMRAATPRIKRRRTRTPISPVPHISHFDDRSSAAQER